MCDDIDATVAQLKGKGVELPRRHTRVPSNATRIRDAATQLACYRVLRVTHRRLVADPGAAAEAVRVLLVRHRAPFAEK
jgi:hypothetical protein